MPLIKGDGFEAPTVGSTQRYTKQKNTVHPSPAPGPSSTGATRGWKADAKSDYEVAMRHYEDVVITLFKSFKTKYKKSYVSKREHETRKNIYRHNLRWATMILTV